MTIFQVGRCEFEEPPSTIDQSGSTVTLSGDLWCGSYAELTARRFQLLGMVNNSDEDVFPFFSTEGALSYLNGFYRVLDGSVGSTTGMADSGVAPYTITLEAVADGHAPAVEVSATAVERTNASSIGGGTHELRRRYDSEGTNAIGVSANRTTFDGYAIFDVGPMTYTYQPSAATFHPGHSMIEVRGADSVWYPWTGRDMPDVDPDDVRISNGLVRFGVTSDGNLRHELWDGSAWDSVDFTLRSQTTVVASVQVFSGVTIVRNSMDAVVVRINARSAVDASYRAQGSFSITLTLLTGELWVGCTVQTVNWGDDFAIRATTSTASTSITGGLRATSNAVNGNRFFIATANAVALRDLAIGELVGSGSGVAGFFSFVLGQSLNGSAAVGRNTEANIVQDWVDTYTSRTQVLAR